MIPGLRVAFTLVAVILFLIAAATPFVVAQPASSRWRLEALGLAFFAAAQLST